MRQLQMFILWSNGYLLPHHFQMPFYSWSYVQIYLSLGLVLG